MSRLLWIVGLSTVAVGGVAVAALATKKSTSGSPPNQPRCPPGYISYNGGCIKAPQPVPAPPIVLTENGPFDVPLKVGQSFTLRPTPPPDFYWHAYQPPDSGLVQAFFQMHNGAVGDNKFTAIAPGETSTALSSPWGNGHVDNQWVWRLHIEA